MALPTIRSFLRKTLSRSSTKKKQPPSSPSSPTPPHRSSSKKPTTASEEEGIEKLSEGQADGGGRRKGVGDETMSSTSSKPMPADEKIGVVKMAERKEGEGEGDVSSVKDRGSSAEEESTSKEHEIVAEREGQEGHRKGEGKLETTPPNLPTPETLDKTEVERMIDEQTERRNVKDDAMSSTSSKPVPADGDLQAGEKPVKMPERNEGEGDVGSVKKEVIAPSSPSSPTLAPTNDASSEGESKSEEHKSTVEREGQDELNKAQGKQGPIPSHLPISDISDASGKGEIEGARVGEAEISNVKKDTIPSASSKPMPADEGIGAGEKFVKMPERNEENGDTSSGKNQGIEPSSPPMFVPTSEASPGGESKRKEHDSTMAREDQDEHKRGESRLEHLPTPETLGQREIERTSEEQPERRDVKDDAHSISLKPMPEDKKIIQAGETAAVSSSSTPSVAKEEKTTKGDDMTPKRKEEEADIKKDGGLKEKTKGTPKMVRIMSKPSYEESRTNDGAIPSAPATPLPGETGSGDRLRDLKDDEIETEKNGAGEGASGWRMPGTKWGAIAMVTAIVCMGSMVLVKRLENIRRRKSA